MPSSARSGTQAVSTVTSRSSCTGTTSRNLTTIQTSPSKRLASSCLATSLSRSRRTSSTGRETRTNPPVSQLAGMLAVGLFFVEPRRSRKSPMGEGNVPKDWLHHSQAADSWGRKNSRLGVVNSSLRQTPLTPSYPLQKTNEICYTETTTNRASPLTRPRPCVAPLIQETLLNPTVVHSTFYCCRLHLLLLSTPPFIVVGSTFCVITTLFYRLL